MKGEIQLKSLILKIIILIVCVGTIIGIFAFYEKKHQSNDFDKDNIVGKIHFILIDENDEKVIDETIEFSEGETLFKILERKHKLVYLDSIGVGKGILEVDEYKTDWYNSYFMLYINGAYSTEGTELIKATDNMEIKLIWNSTK